MLMLLRTNNIIVVIQCGSFIFYAGFIYNKYELIVVNGQTVTSGFNKIV